MARGTLLRWSDFIILPGMSGYESPVDFYARPGQMTSAGPHAPVLAALKGVETVAAVVHGALLHDAWAQHYDQVLTPGEGRSHTAADARDTRYDHGDRSRPARHPAPTGEAQHRHVPPFHRSRLRGTQGPGRPGTCPLRLRHVFRGRQGHRSLDRRILGRRALGLCGFPDRRSPARRLELDFDPLDQPPGKFLSAGETWQRCRAGAADPGKFGIFDESGFWFIAMNLVRDFAALNNMEMLPWDIRDRCREPEEEMSSDGSPASIVSPR